MAKEPEEHREPRERGYARKSDRGMKWPLIVGGVFVVLVLLAWAGAGRGSWLPGGPVTPAIDADIRPVNPAGK